MRNVILQPPAGATEQRRAVVRVVDDEPAIQDLFQLLGQREGFAVQAFGSARPFLATLDEDQPGCVVLDLNLPDCPGLEVLETIARAGRRIPVVCMSGLAGVNEAVRALKLGSLDFVAKPFALGDMAAAIHRALDLDRQWRQTQRQQFELQARFQTLTPREREVMDLVVAGLPNKRIATHLGVSPKTVEVHRAHVMQKSRAGSLAELVRLTIAAGLQPPRQPEPVG